jgi:hypothetical protein
LAGIFALGVALIPMNICNVQQGWVLYRGYLHWTCAALLFTDLALTSLLLFTRSDTPKPMGKKARRNKFYRFCSWTMLVCMGLIGLLKIAPTLAARVDGYKPVFWLETGVVVSFGVAWLVKGETFGFVRD